MSWQLASLLLLGGSTVLLFIGMPVAFSFIAINIVGAMLFLGGDAGLQPNGQEQRGGGGQFLADADSAVRSDGRGALPYRAGAQGDRRHRAADSPGARRLAVVAVVAGTVFSAISGSTIATTAMLGSLMLPVMLARGYNPVHGDRTDHGDRRGRHADPAVRANRAARQPVRNFDFEAADRRGRSGPDAQRRVRRLHHCPRGGATRRWRRRRRSKKGPAGRRYELLVCYVLPLVSIFVVVIGAMSGGIATPTESAALGRAGHHGACRRLSRADVSTRCSRRCAGRSGFRQ